MVSKELNDWLQVVGLFGVFGGLIFVGLQLRLDRQVAIQQSVSQGYSAQLAWTEVMSEHSEVWVKGLVGDPLSTAEQAEFDALAESRELGYYAAWTGSRQLGEEQPERWARVAALDFHTYPGLMAFWRKHLEHQELTDPDGLSDPWLASVIAEVARLEASRE
jgi:hypothetical protein